MLLDIFKSAAVGVRLAACLLALTVLPRLMEAQQGLSRSSRDVSVSGGYWYHHGTHTGITPLESLELKGPNTKVLWVPNLFVDGTLIIKDGATLELFEGDAEYGFGLNRFRKPDVHTVVDISGPGSSLIAKNVARTYELVIGGGARSTTINISNGGSFVFEHTNPESYGHIQIAGPNFFGKQNDLTINITGAGSRMAILTPTTARMGFDHVGSGIAQHGPTIALSRGGLLDLGTQFKDVYYTRFRFAIGDDGTGKVASGLFRLRSAFLGGSNFGLSVAPCTTLRPGDQFVLAEYSAFYPNSRYMEGLDWASEEGNVSWVANGGEYANGGYKFRIQYNVDLGRNFPGSEFPALGIVATVTGVPPATSSRARCGKAAVTLAVNTRVPYTVTGHGCEPGLYWDTRTLYMDAHSTCRIAHNDFFAFSRWDRAKVR